MYAGFISTTKTLNRLGIHQRFDVAAYNMISSYLQPGGFPRINQILSFEGFNGPDGLKVKSPGVHEPSHLYDPRNDTGEVPMHIGNHYIGLVKALQAADQVKAAFEASWLAHYVTDGLTPAHHFPLEERLAAIKGDNDFVPRTAMQKALHFKSGEKSTDILRRVWLLWGGKGLLSTHQNFELGVATVLLLHPMRFRLDNARLAEARQLGHLAYFKQEARQIAGLELYDRFYREGWNADIAKTLRDIIAPRTAQAIGIIWLLAHLEAGMAEVVAYESGTE